MKKKILSLACAVAMVATMFTSFVVNAADPDITLTGNVSADNKTITVNVGTTFTTTMGYTINLYETTGNITISADNLTGNSAIASSSIAWNKTFKRIACVFADMNKASNDIVNGNLGSFTIKLAEPLANDVTFDFKTSPVFTFGDGTKPATINKCAPLTLSPNKAPEVKDAAPTVAITADTTTAHTKAGYIWDVEITPNTAKSNTAITSMNAKFTDSNSNVKNNAIKGDFSKFKGAGAIGMKVGLATNRTVNSFEFSATNSTGTGTDTWNAQ